MEPAIKQLLGTSKIAAEVIFIPKETALDSLEEKTGLQGMADSLGKNPLPDSYIIRLSDNTRTVRHYQPESKPSPDNYNNSPKPTRYKSTRPGPNVWPHCWASCGWDWCFWASYWVSS